VKAVQIGKVLPVAVSVISAITLLLLIDVCCVGSDVWSGGGEYNFV
jgi:hypothetical protein